jgi:hypothetical protein
MQFPEITMAIVFLLCGSKLLLPGGREPLQRQPAAEVQR